MASTKKGPGTVLADLFPSGLGDVAVVGEASPRERLRAILHAAQKCGGTISAAGLRAFARDQRQLADAAEEMAFDVERADHARIGRILKGVERPVSITDYLRPRDGEEGKEER